LRRALALDYYFDEMAQVRMPRWSSGRVALLGDAAFGPSPMSGQGTSLALIGAYLLAHHVDTAPDVATAFSEWKNGFRAHVLQNQRLAGDGLSVLLPGSRRGIGGRMERRRGRSSCRTRALDYLHLSASVRVCRRHAVDCQHFVQRHAGEPLRVKRPHACDAGAPGTSPPPA
jgi:2-polyprenyl-6-methoxyphenol hydroxylase-like FAD-dependent oxidoreductase